MALTRNYNFVTFLYGDDVSQRIQLTLSGDWTRKGGMQPDLNTATTHWTERAKLPTNLINIIGIIEFWWTADPTAEVAEGDDPAMPDVVLGNISLVGCVPDFIGRESGDTTPRVVTYRFSFADHRHAYSEPRGGRLLDGLGNPDPLGDATLVGCKALVNKCCTAMGIAPSAPDTLNATQPPRQIEWFGAHAPSEMSRLLQHTGHVYCPSSGGGAFLQELFSGDLPAPGDDRVVADITIAGVPRLPQIAIFTSSPNAIVRTFTQAAAGDNVPHWEYVAQDPADGYKYKALADIAALGGDPVNAVKKGFQAASAADRKLLSDQVYKLIRLKGDRFNRLQSPLLRDVLLPDGTSDSPHLVATVAVRHRGTAHVNTPSVRLNARTVDGAANILAFDQRLGTVAGVDERADLDAFFTPISAASIKPTFSVEDWDGAKRYAIYGFQIGDGVVSAMDDTSARGCLVGFRPNTAIYSAPELRLIYLNDDTNNNAALATNAQAMASAMIVADTQPQTLQIKGFYHAEINGRVSEIRYSQADPTTTIIIDGWTCPLGGGPSRRVGNERRPTGGDGDTLSGSLIKPTARTHKAARDYVRGQQGEQGGSLSRPVNQGSTPAPISHGGARPIIVTAGNAIATGRHDGTSRSGQFSLTASGAYAVNELGLAAPAVDCEIRSGNGLTYPLQAGEVIVGVAGEVNSAGKLIVYHQAHVGTFPVMVYQDGGSDGSATSAASWTYTIKTVNGDVITTGVSPYKSRPFGLMDQAATGSYGLAFIANGQVILWDVNEVPPTTNCVTTPPSSSEPPASEPT